jgi:hypothetical protein
MFYQEDGIDDGVGRTKLMKRNRYVTCSSCDAMNPSFNETCDQCGARLNDIPTDESTQPEQSVRSGRALSTADYASSDWHLDDCTLPNVVAGVYLWFWLPKHIGGLAGSSCSG